MAGWGKLVAGALIGVAGTVYATNEEFRKNLPGAARDLPVAIRRRLENAVSAGKAASSERRAEILRDLEKHGGQHPVRETHLDFTEEVESPPSEATENQPQDPTQPAEHGKQHEQEHQG
ncbi:MAG: hypothetical protein ACR2HO_13140 [Rubrobacteraceae bacterium]|nr:hypothetical protein [Rubrobacter sp.]